MRETGHRREDESQKAQSVQIITPFFSLARRLRCCTRKQLGAGELHRGLLGHHTDREFARQVSARQLEVLGRVGLVDVDDGGLCLVAPCASSSRESSETSSVSGTPRGVVIGSHGHPPLPCSRVFLYQRRTLPPTIRARKAGLYVICITYEQEVVRNHAGCGASTVPMWSHKSPRARPSVSTVGCSAAATTCPPRSCSRSWPW